jgi:hypothetical protein
LRKLLKRRKTGANDQAVADQTLQGETSQFMMMDEVLG